MTPANDAYRDAALRNAVALRRYSAGLARRIAELMALADAELAAKLNTRLTAFEGLGRAMDFTGERWKALLLEIRDTRLELIRKVKDTAQQELFALGAAEAANELDTLEATIPVEVSFASVASDQLRAIVSARPFYGRLLKDWFQGLELADRGRVVQALQLGMAQGEPTPEIVRRLIGTKANMFTDGILSMSRRDATAIVRTAVNHVSNVAREYVWDANADVILARVWTSTLDGRTSAVCRARDGHAVPVGDNKLPPELPALKPADARPPAHINCRSTMIAIISPEGLLGNRPFVIDTRTPDRRRIDFRAEAKATNRTERAVREEWASKNIGRVPAATDYQAFMERQSASFQDAVLGKTKAKLFRTGKIRLDEYVDRRGNELTLEQLAARRPDVFRDAGVPLPP